MGVCVLYVILERGLCFVAIVVVVVVVVVVIPLLGASSIADQFAGF